MLTRIGKYEVRREIGRGSMGIVYEAYDPYIRRSVALKVAQVSADSQHEAGRRFQRLFFNEAHTAGLLHHPGILDIFDAGVEDSRCYIVMELIPGGATLRPYCAASNLLPLNQVTRILFQCAKALDYAHRRGVIHRDIKPSNLLLTPNFDARIADFSIAHITHPDLSSTLPLGFVGSPRYMAPEQVLEELVTGQTDLFALGVVGYELLTGVHPFGAEGFSALMHRVVNEEPIPLRARRPELPPSLEEILALAMAKDPADRFQDGVAMAAALSAAFAELYESPADMSARQRIDTLARTAFFTDFGAEQLAEVERTGIWLEVTQGENVVTEGEADDAVYFLMRGEATVERDGKVLERVGIGGCFGEIAYLRRVRRTASVRAQTPVSVLKLNATLLDRVSPSTQLAFYRAMSTTLVERLAATTQAWLAG